MPKDIFDRISQPPQIKSDPLGLFDVEKARAAGYSPERIRAFQTGEIPVLSGDPRDFIKRPIGATGSFAPDWKDWATGYISSFSTGITKGFDSPEHQQELANFQEIDKQVAEPVFQKASKIASFAALAIYGIEGIKAIPELWRLAKGALSKPLTPQQQLETARYLREQGFEDEAKTIKDLAKKFPEIFKQLVQESRRGVRVTPTALLPAPPGAVVSPPLPTVKPPVPSPASPIQPPAVGAPPPQVAPTVPPGTLVGKAGRIALEPIAQGLETLETAKLLAKSNVAAAKKLFTRFDQLEPETRQKFINISEGDTELKEKAAQSAVELTQQFDDATLESVYQNLQEPVRVALPPGTEQLKDTLIDLKKWSFKELNKPFLTTQKDIQTLERVVDNDLPIPSALQAKLKVPKWPDNEINRLNLLAEELQVKLGHTEAPEAQAQLQEQLGEVQGRIERLSNVEYFHQITSKPEGIRPRIAGRRFAKTISRKPHAFLGRKFATREDAKAAGRTVGSLPAAVADVIYETNRVRHMDEFIKSINRNPEFSKRADLAPTDWVTVDERIFPSGKFRKFHPAIADALKEITYVSNKGTLTRAYDKVNTIGKIIGFYNPIFMTRYNVSQGIRAAGFTWPRALPKAIKIWSEKGDTYNYLRRNGLFNNVFDLKPAMTDITDQLRASIEKAPVSEKFKAIARENLNPVKLAHNTWKFLNEGTWKIDEMQRIATWLLLKDNPRLARHYSDFEIIELANDFHANYGKVPKATREQLNRAIFTPTYRVSMARIVGRMHSEPKALWPSLLRHYGMKILFNKYLPMALSAYFAYKKLGKRARVEGYRVIISEPGAKKETVYSISDPLLEATKILNRPYNRTIEYNLAVIPAAMVRLLRGPLWKSKDPDWKETVNSFFKIGIPGLRELKDWEREDVEGWQKFVQSLGFAFIYQRNRQPELQRPAMESLMRAMDLWIDWKTFLNIREPKTLFKQVMKAAKAKGKNQAEVRTYMQDTWGEKNFGKLSYAARKDVLQHFSPEK